jgi:EAL domain-containing protein (putative c-di-GMP-specific phosphodiesterase class I)/DNA-binding response OmpR family regulator
MRDRDELRGGEENRKAKILVLDNDQRAVAQVRAALGEPDYRVMWASNLEDALKKVTGLRPDLALVDVNARAGDGWDFLHQLRKRGDMAGLPVISLTALDDNFGRLASLQRGADRYLVKPLEAETLRRVVNELLAAHDKRWWNLSVRADDERLRDLFFDTSTELPTLTLAVEELRKRIEGGESFEVYCLELEPLFRLGERTEWDWFDRLRKQFSRGLQIFVSRFIGPDVIVSTSYPGAHDFYCFARSQTTSKRDRSAVPKELERASRMLLRQISSNPLLVEDVAIFAGGSVTQQLPVDGSRILYSAIREAKDGAQRRETGYFHGLREAVMRAIRDRKISTVFQPVMNLRNNAILGYEALSRGPRGSEIESPELIFELAREFQLVWELESLCLQNVTPLLGDVCSRGLLFLNLESHFIQMLHERGTGILAPLLPCDRIVIEVTERSAIRDFAAFRSTLRDLKSMGFHIAIDDCGSGYATLEAIAELEPDYLKVGHSLFQNVATDPIRRRLVELVARCADSIGATTIAEAIETQEQLDVCLELGIDKGQGYVFARPAPWDEIKEWAVS